MGDLPCRVRVAPAMAARSHDSEPRQGRSVLLSPSWTLADAAWATPDGRLDLEPVCRAYLASYVPPFREPASVPASHEGSAVLPTKPRCGPRADTSRAHVASRGRREVDGLPTRFPVVGGQASGKSRRLEALRKTGRPAAKRRGHRSPLHEGRRERWRGRSSVGEVERGEVGGSGEVEKRSRR